MCKRLIRAVSLLGLLSLSLANTARADLAGWWKFDETSGTIAEDSAGSNHATLQGDPQWTDGQINNALTLDGVDDYVDLPIGSLVASLSDTTIAVWVNYSGQGGAWQRIFDFGTGTANYIYLCAQDGNGLMHAAITANTGVWTDITTGSGALPTGWHHVAVTIDGELKILKILLDGEIVANASTLYVLKDLGVTTQNRLGRSQYEDPYFNGVLDDFRIYDEALSPEQILKIMEGEMYASMSPNPVDGATDVYRDAVLSWTPGKFADTHNVYFGTALEDVNARPIRSACLSAKGRTSTPTIPADSNWDEPIIGESMKSMPPRTVASLWATSGRSPSSHTPIPLQT